MANSGSETACQQSCDSCYTRYVSAEDAGMCPLAQELLYGVKRRTTPSVAGKAAWQILIFASTHENFTRRDVIAAHFTDGELGSSSLATRQNRFLTGLERLNSTLGEGILAQSVATHPRLYMLNGQAVTEWCIRSRKYGTISTATDAEVQADGGADESDSAEDQDEDVVDRQQFKKLKVLPGLVEITFNYIMSAQGDVEEEAAKRGALDATIAEAIEGTGRPALVKASLAEAAKRCVSNANLRQYGRTPGALERFTRISRLRETLG